MSGYEILSLDDLEAYPDLRTADAPQLIPLRHRLGLRAFGANCWTAQPGKQLVPRHSERSGDEELYVVVRGRATFTVDGETIAAPAGTLIHVLPGEEREAFADEPGTIVLAAGATPGEPFVARGWDEVVVAFAKAHGGDVAAGRADIEALVGRNPEAWEGAYNLACFEARFGDPEAAFDHLHRALARAPEDIRPFARDDEDLEPLHGDPRWQALVG